MQFTAMQLDYQIDCGECEYPKGKQCPSFTPDALLSHLVEDHEYSVKEAETYLDSALTEADEKYQKQLEDYYEDRTYERSEDAARGIR